MSALDDARAVLADVAHHGRAAVLDACGVIHEHPEAADEERDDAAEIFARLSPEAS
ncbi:hypothetical protein [Roseivivax isoporae]|uniref:Uncharacterized protein n=1 Tax=Roseivivax isoporae LMG 25204 TaxID=1449351 RepID=X7F395_9RHOB|nr:hypothetical protein [Roseivivax isoporae]ETX26541.1 hypothetical protein RISW2_22820 [Roseivivax isoporae LMG 25204]